MDEERPLRESTAKRHYTHPKYVLPLVLGIGAAAWFFAADYPIGVPIVIGLPIAGAIIAFPEIGLVLMCAMTPLAPLTDLYEGHFTAYKAVGILVALGYFINVTLGRQRLPRGPIPWLFGAYIGLVSLSIFWYDPTKYGFVVWLTQFNHAAWVIIMMSFCKDSHFFETSLAWLIAGAYAGAIAPFFLPSHVFSGLRMSVGETNPNHWAASLAIGLMASIYLYTRSRSVILRFGLLAGVVPLLIMIVLSGSRMTWLGLLTAALACGIFLRPATLFRITAIVLLLLPIALAVIQLNAELGIIGGIQLERARSISFRSPDWEMRRQFHKDALHVIRRSPFFGAGGPRQYDEYVGSVLYLGRGIVPDPHNLFLDIAAFFGLPALTIFVLILALIAIKATRIQYRPLRLFSLCLLLFVLVFSITHAGFTQKHFWLTICFSVGAAEASSTFVTHQPEDETGEFES